MNAAHTPTLKACPFCGGEALLENTITEVTVMCCDCPARIRRHHEQFGDEAAKLFAVTQWNTRPIEDALVEALEAIRSAGESANLNHKDARVEMMLLADQAIRLAQGDGSDD